MKTTLAVAMARMTKSNTLRCFLRMLRHWAYAACLYIISIPTPLFGLTEFNHVPYSGSDQITQKVNYNVDSTVRSILPALPPLCASQPRPLAHVLLDGGQHVLRRRGKDVQVPKGPNH